MVVIAFDILTTNPIVQNCNQHSVVNINHVDSGLARAVPSSTNLFNQESTNLTIHLRGVQCDGNEVNLLDCRFQLNNKACKHNQDAGVFCLGDRVTTTLTTIITTPSVSTTTLPPRICMYTVHMCRSFLSRSGILMWAVCLPVCLSVKKTKLPLSAILSYYLILVTLDHPRTCTESTSVYFCDRKSVL